MLVEGDLSSSAGDAARLFLLWLVLSVLARFAVGSVWEHELAREAAVAAVLACFVLGEAVMTIAAYSAFCWVEAARSTFIANTLA